MERHWKYRALFWNHDTQRWQWLRKKATKLGFCPVRGCGNAVSREWRRGKLTYRTYCEKCHNRQKRINNPLKTMWHELRHSAKRRKIPCKITYGQFLLFCHEHEFYYRSPQFNATTLTVDRLDPTRGYTMDNIQLVTQSVNAKRNRAHQLGLPEPTEPEYDPDNCPF